ncbi:hypothetical protein As57867_018806, partial [Aphanomyces stellatus]
MLRHLRRVKLPFALRSRQAAAASCVRAFHANTTVVAPIMRLNRAKFMQGRNFASIDVPVPSMGDSISEGTVVEWVKNVGDRVEADDVVVVIETDKVSVDVRTPHAGVVTAHLADVDDNVNVGAPLFSLDQGAAGGAAPAAAAPAASASSPAVAVAPVAGGDPVTVNVPSMGDSISEGTVVSWTKGPGDHVDADEVVLVIETDKVSVDVRAPQAGVIKEGLVQVDDVVAIGAPLFTIIPGAAPAGKAAAPAAVAAP